jgi:hypothetical protein
MIKVRLLVWSQRKAAIMFQKPPSLVAVVRMSAQVTCLISVKEPQGKLIAACALQGSRKVWRFRTCGACEFEEGQGHPRAQRIAQGTVPQ